MKWFKHETDSHMNLKLQSVIDKFGISGYGYYWACVELVGKEGVNFRIKSEKDWKNHFKKFLNIELEMQETFLEFFAEKELIDKKGLTKGYLYIPKLEERQDDYTKKRRTKYGQDTDNVPLEEKRIDKKRIEEKPLHETFDYLSKIPDTDLKEFTERFAASNSQIKSKCEDLINYCQSSGKKYKNYKAFLLNALKKDFKERINEKPVKKFVAPVLNEEMLAKRREVLSNFKPDFLKHDKT